MLSKSEIKYIQSLTQKKFRQQYGQFIIEGPKLIHELFVRKPAWLKHIYGNKSWWEQQSHAIQNEVQAFFTEIELFELEKISSLQAPQDVLAIVEMPIIEKQPLTNDHWILALDGIRDPGNMGTIIRTAHWFGVHQIFCSHDCVDSFSSKVVQASMGSIFCVNIFYEDLSRFLANCSAPVYGALLSGVSINKIVQPAKGIILIGNEGKGIRQELIPFITHAVTIPGKSDAESLNAAIAAGILMYKFI